MRKLLLVSLLLMILSPLAASHIISDGTLPDDVLSSLSVSVGKETWGRGDLIAEASSYREEHFDDDLILASFMLSYGEKEVLLEFSGSGRADLLESLEREIHNLLFYEESLYSDGDIILGYALPASYSVSDDLGLRRGTRLNAIDSLGKTRAVFEVEETFPSATVLEPLYLDVPYPGMTLEKAGAWRVSASAATGFDFSSPDILSMVSIGRTDLIYPFVPIISAAYRYSDGKNYAYGGIGIEAYLDIWRIFPDVSFTLLEEGRIGANASVLLGASDTGFDWIGVFSVFYEHRALPSFFWRLGYENMQGKHMFLLSMGGDF